MQMKRFPFLQVAVMVALMVVVVGCSMPRSVAGGYYEDSEPTNRNGYYGNTYGGNVIVVERDPFTGRYYEVSPYGVYGTPNRYYGNGYGNRYYNSRNYNSRNYNNRNSRNNNNSYYRNDNSQNRQAQEQQRRETTRQMDAAKESILGQKKN
jgi:hypothetical protein